MIRFAAKHMDRRWVRVRDAARACRCSGSRPASPTLDQLEVAIASLRAVITAEQLAEVEARPQRLRSAGVRPALGPA